MRMWQERTLRTGNGSSGGEREARWWRPEDLDRGAPRGEANT